MPTEETAETAKTAKSAKQFWQATAARFDVLEEKMDKLDSKFSDIHLVLSRLAKRDEIMRNALFAADEEEEAPLKKVGIRRPRNVPSALPNK